MYLNQGAHVGNSKTQVAFHAIETQDYSHITSFSYKVIQFIQNSNILYPSNCELRHCEDRGSIEETLESVDIFDRKIKGWSHTCGKPLRAALRAIVYIPLQLVAAPVGVLYNGTMTSWHIVCWLGSTKGTESCDMHLKKLEAYAYAFFVDLALTVAFGLISIVPSSIIVTLITGKTAIDASVIGLLAFSTLCLSFPAIGPLETLNCFLDSDSCGPAYKAVKLKNQHGLVNPNGSILKYNLSTDKESDKNPGLFWKMTVFAAYRQLKMIKKLQKQLPADCKIEPHCPPSTEKIVAHLKAHRTETGFSDELFDGWLKEIKKLGDEYGELREDYIDIVKMQAEGNPIFNAMARQNVTVTFNPSYPYYKEFVNSFFNESAEDFNEPDQFEINLNDAKKLLESSKNTEEQAQGHSEIFRNLRKMILENDKIKPYEILGLKSEPNNYQELRDAYKKYVFIHPDRCPDVSFAKEYEEIFKCVETAYTDYERLYK